jgi:hypothetical protein
MATDRTNIIRGPGAVLYDGITLHDADGITAEVQTPTQDVLSSAAGRLDTIKTDQMGSITLTPCGELSAEILAVLYPHQSPVPGSSIMGSADKPLAIHSRAGRKVTFTCAALSSIPDLVLSPVATAFGEAQFAAVVGKGLAPDTAGSLWTEAAAAYASGEPGSTGLTGCLYSATWAGLSIPDTATGWRITFELQLEPVVADSVGTVDFTLAGINVHAACTPLGVSESDVLSALSAHAARGTSVATENDLVISAAGGLTVTLKRAALVAGPLKWGSAMLRAGELGFTANRASDGKLYSVALTPSAPGSPSE